MLESLSESKLQCKECQKNKILVKKYEKLVGLYNKKKHRESEELSSRLSQGKTTSHTSGIDYLDPKVVKLLSLLQIMYFKRTTQFFSLATIPSAKKFLMTVLINKISLFHKRKGFYKIYQAGQNRVEEFCGIINQISIKRVKIGFQQIKQFCGQSTVSLQMKQNFPGDPQRIDRILDGLAQIRRNISLNLKKNLGTNIAKVNIQLQIANEKLRAQNQILKESLEQSNRRQKKQNQKKKQSLEMLAEELLEKNEIIADIKASLKTYEQKFNANGNVLLAEDDIPTLKKQIDNLQKIRDRLQHELSKARDRIQQYAQKNKQLDQKILDLEKQAADLRRSCYEKDQETKIVNIKNSQLEQTIQIFAKKIKRISAYEKELQGKKNEVERSLRLSSKKISLVGSISNGNVNENQLSFVKKSCDLMDEAKAEIILCFLQNIEVNDEDFKGKQLFDAEQVKALMDHKNKYLGLKNEKDLDYECQMDNVRQELSPHQYQLRGGPSASLFSALNTPQNQDSGYQIQSSSQGRKDKNMTVKLLQLELEKNKQIQKISELKEKIMHIRVIILNLMKSLELQQVKPDTQRVLSVIFDMFEYSEEERQSIFVKKKKIFGFI